MASEDVMGDRGDEGQSQKVRKKYTCRDRQFEVSDSIEATQ